MKGVFVGDFRLVDFPCKDFGRVYLMIGVQTDEKECQRLQERYKTYKGDAGDLVEWSGSLDECDGDDCDADQLGGGL